MTLLGDGGPTSGILEFGIISFLDSAMPSHRFTIFADYFQFVLMDEDSEDDFSELWTDEALHRMLAIGAQAVCPGTLRNINVPVEIVVSSGAPQVALADYDHAVETFIKVPSGRLIVMGCSDYLPEAPRIEVPPGTLRVLFLASGLESITTESESADDRYVVHLWPGEACETKLLKLWRNDARS